MKSIKRDNLTTCALRRGFFCRERADYTPEALADQVDWSSLPGAENLEVKGGFNMFSGYVNVDRETGRNIFYWFMEAQEKAEDAPVVRHNRDTRVSHTHHGLHRCGGSTALVA